jgi:hypothetical protein
MTETVYILLKFRGSKKAKLTQQPIELKSFCPDSDSIYPWYGRRQIWFIN